MRQYVPYFGYRRHSIRAQQLDISYWDEGSGPPLILVHGLGGCLEYWAWVFPLLVRQFRVIALDLPGFGESSLPNARDLRVEQAVELLWAFARALRLDRPILVGHSMGGALALRCAAAHPDAFAGVMALCPPGFGRDIDLVSRVLSVPLLGEALFQPTHTTVFSALKCPRSVAGIEHLVRLTYARLRRKDGVLRHLTILRQGVNLFGQTLRFHRDELATLPERVKIVWGEYDTVFPVKQAERAARLLPHADVTIIPAGHILLVEQPGIIGRLIAEFAAPPVARQAA